jgi:catechol 2,3-dioxygenase-like lactoylglutathione lyase family enzyme
MAVNDKPPAIGANRAMLHHVSLPVRDVAQSVGFYRDVLGLTPIPRPDFDFKGAWFALGTDQQLHLIQDEGSTFRDGKGLDGRDIHFAIRIGSYRDALAHLAGLGYRKAGSPGIGEFQCMRVVPKATAGFPQIYLMDPDRNIIEINADTLDADDDEIAGILAG